MAAARFWRLLGIEAYADGDLELAELHLYDAAGRVDATAVLTCSHAPIAGALTGLGDANTATTCRFAAAAVRSPGFRLQWDFGPGGAKDITYLRLCSGGDSDLFLARGCLQQSPDGQVWDTYADFGRVIYPGAFAYTPIDPIFRPQASSEWDEGSKGGSTTISGRVAEVWGVFSGIARTNVARTAGRRVFGLRLTQVNPPQEFFAGLAALSGWGSYNVGKHWSMYGSDGAFWYYPTGAEIALTPPPGAPTAVGDVMLYDVDLDAGTIALKKNNGAWSGRVSLPNFVVGADYVIDIMAPSSSSAAVGAALMTTAAELHGHIPSGAKSWDAAVGSQPMLEPDLTRTNDSAAQVCASNALAAHQTRRFSASVARDVEFGGRGTVYGTTKTKGTPNLSTKARVVLLHQRSKLPVRETWSDPVSGAFVFAGVDTSQQFLVVAEDAEGHFRPVAANRLTPEVV